MTHPPHHVVMLTVTSVGRLRSIGTLPEGEGEGEASYKGNKRVDYVLQGGSMLRDSFEA